MGRTIRKEKDWDRPRYKRNVTKTNTDIYSEEDIDYAEELYTEETRIRRKPTTENSKNNTRRGKRR